MLLPYLLPLDMVLWPHGSLDGRTGLHKLQVHRLWTMPFLR